jgi:Zn-dependent peptidase ImmA (M78 family)/transcriptional regulator with XRE-family HTH domain
MDEEVRVADPATVAAWLREARRARSLTQAQVAEELGIARTSLVAIEKGERRVKAAELVHLARLYGRHLDELLRPAPPMEDFAVQFRLPPYARLDVTDIDQPLMDFQQLVEDYLELERITETPSTRRYPPPYEVEGLRPHQAAEQIAQLERSRLGLGDGPLPQLREVLENDVGLRIFHLTLPSRIAGLFSYQERAGGCIAINAKHPLERQRWSLAHEYGHFLTRRYKSEVTVLQAYERVPSDERIADSFAEYFLMPTSGLTRRFNDLRRASPKGPTPTLLLELATLYGVSLQALILRLETLRLLASGTWEHLEAAGFKVQEARQILDLPSPTRETDQFPTRYKSLAVEAYRQGLITEGQFSRLLRMDRVSARRVAEGLSRQEIVTEDGTLTQVGFDFSGPSRSETG